MDKIDIGSKGEVVRYIENLLKKGQVKKCSFLKITQGYLEAYYPEKGLSPLLAALR